jgi:hypothetical protein
MTSSGSFPWVHPRMHDLEVTKKNTKPMRQEFFLRQRQGSPLPNFFYINGCAQVTKLAKLKKEKITKH